MYFFSIGDKRFDFATHAAIYKVLLIPLTAYTFLGVRIKTFYDPIRVRVYHCENSNLTYVTADETHISRPI